MTSANDVSNERSPMYKDSPIATLPKFKRSKPFALALLLALACLTGASLPSTAGAASTAWAPIAASGPTNLPPQQSEIQRLGIDAEGGSYTLTVTRVNVLASGTGNYSFLSKTVTGVTTTSGAFAVGQTVTGNGIPAATTITAVGAGTLTLSNSPACCETFTGAPLTVSESVQATTPAIAFNASAAELESILNALSTISVGGGSVQVSGGPGNGGAEFPYNITFTGSLAGSNQPAIVANGSLLTGGQNHAATVTTALNGGPGTAALTLFAQNIGGFTSSGTVTVAFQLPTGVTTSATPSSAPKTTNQWTCTPPGAGQSSVTCTTTQTALPGFTLPVLYAPIVAGPTAATGPVHMTVSGGGAVGTAEYDMPLIVSSEPAEPGFQSLVAGAHDSNGVLDTRAGAHPYSASAGILVATKRSASGSIVPVGEFKDIMVQLPPGFIGNPIAVPACSEALKLCPAKTVVATVQIPINEFAKGGSQEPVYNIEAPFGFPAKFRFEPGAGFEQLNVISRLRSDEDYGLEVGSVNTPQIQTVFGSFFTFWGAPNDVSHDSQRCNFIFSGGGTGCEAGGENIAFLTNPTNCAEEAAIPPVTTLDVNTWSAPDEHHIGTITLPPVTECDKLHFEADFKFEPSDTKADSTASFRTELTVPSDGLTDPTKLTVPEIKETVVKLPEGVSLNPSGADGLQACSLDQIGFRGGSFPMPNPMRFTKDPNQCPEASKIGTGELKSALIEEPLHGALYLAAQGDGNPFGSLFAVYLVIEDPRHGIFVKLPGKVEPDKRTGQFQVTFSNLPQLPFTYLKLDLKGGNRSALASPTTCGTFVTEAVNTPWSAPESGPPTVSSNGFEINQGPNGGPCAPTKEARPFDLGLTAGTDSTTAGAYTPLTFQITRPDGSQELNTLDLGTAPGLVASLRGVPECAASNAAIEAKTGKQELASSSCPPASQIGRTLTGAGAGPTPFYSSGKLYLAGPYKGAPLSVLAVTPAVAGPFDLGNVVVRTALFINRSTAQVTAKTDPIPQILEGVPLRIKDVRVVLDRANFSLNPTSCDPTAITVHATGNSGAVKDLSTRFQVGGCGNLDFGPKLRANLKGATKRGGHPAFTAEVNFPAGQANTKDVQVTIPHSEFLEQAHINTICTRPQAAANACPSGAIYGFAEAETPLLDGKLTGPVFLKANPNHKLPDLAIALKGPANQPVEVEFAGRIDSVKGQIRNTIEGLPDVPVSRFVLRMKGGRKGLLANSRNLCAAKVTKMTVNMVGHNNKTTQFRPPLTRSCKGKAKKVKRAAKRHQRLNRPGTMLGLVGRAW